MVGGVGHRLLEEGGDSFLHIVDGNEINVLGRNRGKVDIHIGPLGGSNSGTGTAVALEFAEELQNTVEGQRLADPSV